MDTQTYRSLLSSDRIAAPTEEKRLDILGDFINHAKDQGDHAGAKHAITLAKKLRDFNGLKDETLTHLNYFEANAWGVLKPAPTPESVFAWLWQNDAMENKIRQLRLARRSPGFLKIAPYSQAQIHTNLGNALSTLGRFVEALECFDRAIAADPAHGMARGNRGICLCTYAHTLPHLVHAPRLCATTKFFQESQDELFLALKLPLEGDRHDGFLKYLGHVTEMLESSDSADGFNQAAEVLRHAPVPEHRYWSWCLRNRLLLNPLNDILMNGDATGDVLHLPSFTANSQQAQLMFGLLNQMKIEFITARLLLFEGSTSTEEHFAEASILLADTLECAALSIGVEKMRKRIVPLTQSSIKLRSSRITTWTSAFRHAMCRFAESGLRRRKSPRNFGRISRLAPTGHYVVSTGFPKTSRQTRQTTMPSILTPKISAGFATTSSIAI
jgi:tetratricopeptide (TPR) repeat protein